MPAEKTLLQVLAGKHTSPPPVWLMRQAGRYLPEYRKLREKAKNFLEFCYTPELALEATLQPLRRFELDAAILFSDILVVPDALGQRVWFEEGVGPRLEPVDRGDPLQGFESGRLADHLAPVYEALEKIKAALEPTVALIGFAGAPWTVATYMVEGGSSRDHATIRAWAYGDPSGFGRLIELLVEVTVEHLSRQIAAGAEAVQLFDSWAGVLPETEFRRWVIAPNTEIVARLKVEHPDVPVIGFPRGAGLLYSDYVAETNVDAVSLDAQVPVSWAAENLPPNVAVQGNLDNVLLATGGAAMDAAIDAILEAFAGRPHVFNLGHGILPHTPAEHVEHLIQRVKGA